MLKEKVEKQVEIEFYNDTDKAWDHTYAMLSHAVRDRQSPFRTGNMAYISGGKPQIRTVVLRHISENLKEVGFHTDYRSPKAQALLKNPHSTLHFYAPVEKLQLIAEGTATLHHKDETAQKAWDKTQALSRRCYLSDQAPSNVSNGPTSGFPDSFTANSHTLQESDIGYENFCVIRINITSWDRLYLHRHGNRRIQFNWDMQQQKFTAQWLVP